MTKLERLSGSRSSGIRMAERARIVLACLGGKRNDEVASKISIHAARRRFAGPTNYSMERLSKTTRVM